MPIASCMAFIQGLLKDLPMPGGAPNLAAFITPLDPDTESDIPTCYVYPLPGTEKRDPKDGGSMPRNTGPRTFSGDKTMKHQMGIWVVWFMADDDPEADLLVPGFMDAMMWALRTSFPNPAILVDPFDGTESQLADTGEEMKYELLPPHATKSQRWNRYDALITVPLTEVISA